MKRIILLIACIATFITMLSTTCFASTTNESYFFQLPREGYYTVLNKGERKEDRSSSYVYYRSPAEGGVYYSIHGYPKENFDTQPTNCTIGDSAIMYPGQKRRIRQYVYEWGYRYAFIGGAPTAGRGNTYVFGYWSPDCAGNYPAAN